MSCRKLRKIVYWFGGGAGITNDFENFENNCIFQRDNLFFMHVWLTFSGEKWKTFPIFSNAKCCGR